MNRALTVEEFEHCSRKMGAFMHAVVVQRVREYAREHMDAGCLGVLAAQAKCSEGELRAWLDDMGKMPSESTLRDIDHIRAMRRERTGGDPYNSAEGGRVY